MTYGELKALVADYMHRSNLEDKIPGFIDFAGARIGRNLRSQENTTVVALSPTTQNFPLPADYRGMREISYVTGGTRIQLRSATVDKLSTVEQTGQFSLFYRINGLSIEIVPFVARDFKLVYYNAPAQLVDDAETNAVLDAYPYLYVYGAMLEAMFYIRDFRAREGALATFTSEIDELNLMTANADVGAQMTIGG